MENNGNEIRVGLLGCGLVALAVHLENRNRFRGAKVVALAETDEKRLQRAKQLAPEVEAHARYEALLEDSTIDAVIISVPYQEHAEATLAALAAGKHVYLEKPFTITLDEAVRVRDAWKNSGLVGSMGFNYRFNPLISRLHAAVLAGQTGKPVCLNTSFSFAPHGGVNWSITRHGEFGALFDLGPHEIDLARFLTGDEVRRVFARPRSVLGANDTLSLEMEMDSGMLVKSLVSSNCIEEHCVMFYGTEGKLTCDLTRTPGLTFQAKKAGPGRLLQDLWGAVGEVGLILEKLQSPWNEPGFLGSVKHFLDAVRSGQQSRPSFEDGFRTHLVIEAAKRSMDSGRSEDVVSL
ncbi:MAG: Gfo/Idh/MocA family oxidoreductase [Acidobacteria bacterium]|nr:Gfo/Idh/MocA family oxidoreductase [Acidobacteriota bacterium]